MDSYRLGNTASFRYDMYMLENVLNDYKLERDINESVLLYSKNASISQISLVHEGFKEKTKAVFAKLLDNIKNLWSRFLETMTGLLSRDETYLNKYKKVILNTPLADGNFMMYDFSKGKSFIGSAKIPAFNFNTLSDSLVSEEEFLNRHFKSYVSSETPFAEHSKRLFRGSDEEINISTKNMDLKEMFNFCMSFRKNIEGIKADMKEIERAGNEAITIIDKIESTNEAFAYSFLTESVLQEIEKVEPGEDRSTLKNVEGQAGDKTDLKNKVEVDTKDIDKVKLYIKICYSFLGAKMSVLQEMYKAYMFIIKDHVKANGATESKSDSKPSKSGKDEPKLKKNFLS